MKVLDELPRNLTLKSHRFKAVAKRVKKFDHVKQELAQLDDRSHLWALLGINCGMTQADLGALTWGMIDLKKGTLTRKRVKTEAQTFVPIVTYKLFRETIKLLKSLSSNKQDGLVFTNDKGGAMYEVRYDDGKESVTIKKEDLFSTYCNRQKRKPIIPLGKYRSIAATALKMDNRFRSFTDYFLGHAPKDISDKHYSAESDEALFEALDFIHKTVFG